MSIEEYKMRKIENIFHENAYHGITSSGLNVFIIEKKGFKKTVAAYGTSFGALNLTQRVLDETVTHKMGLAHFLEHKLFEDEEGDILSQFTELGASANAFTSYDKTVYYFSTYKDIEAPLTLLMKLINRIYVDEASIEKEKGIIIEELKMYANNPNMFLLMQTYENVFQKFPMKYDIGGTEASVSDTNLEDVLRAYDMNYRPERMAVVVVSGEEPSKIFEMIEKFPLRQTEPMVIEDVFEPEPLSVALENEVIPFMVKTPKASLSFKFKYEGTHILKDEFLIRTLLNINFSQLNDDFQSWIDLEIINNYFSFDVDLQDGFGVIYFFNEGEKNDQFKSLVTSKMENLELDVKVFDQITKRSWGESILTLDNYDRYAINVMTAYFKKIPFYEYLESIRSVRPKDVEAIMVYLRDFSVAYLELIPKVK